MNENIIVDSDITLEDALKGQLIPKSVRDNLMILDVLHYGFDNKIHVGQLVVNKEAAKDLKEIFEFIYASRFPIEKVKPICEYKWSDDESMKDNNTSCFNYRFISGTRVLSLHANGLAIDINPVQNPYVKNGITSPEGSEYDTTLSGTISPDSQLVFEFKKRGWSWGGEWQNLKDYQHFQKDISSDRQH